MLFVSLRRSLAATRKLVRPRQREFSSSLQGPPISLLVPPGLCQFSDAFQSVPLVERTPVSATSSVLRFALPDPSQPLKLSTCACLLAKATIHNEDVIRPYTPISTNALVGHMDLLVKDYGEQGVMSRKLHEMELGETIAFQHIPPNVKIQAPFAPNNIVLVAGGTGITPMIQALHALLGDAASSSKGQEQQQRVTLLYGSQRSDDILAKDLLDAWAENYSDRLQVVHVVSDEPATSGWTGLRGRIDQELLNEYLDDEAFPSKDDTLVLVCGPPPMYQALCGPRNEPETVKGLLGDLGYKADQVYKF
jgi:cytochrome-b5 reductase